MEMSPHIDILALQLGNAVVPQVAMVPLARVLQLAASLD